MPDQADVIIVGSGLAGLVAAAELADAGKRVLILDQEPEQSLAGRRSAPSADCSSSIPRAAPAKNSRLPRACLQDWLGSAASTARRIIGRANGRRPTRFRRRRETRLAPRAGHALVSGGRLGGTRRRMATGHGNSVPRFHITWGTGPGVLAPFLRRVREAQSKGLVSVRFRHRVTALTRTVAPSMASRARSWSRAPSSAARRARAWSSDVRAQGAGRDRRQSGGIGGNHDLVRRNWPRQRLGEPPERMLPGVPDHVDGLMLDVAERAGGRLINGDRMWHYVEGIHNWAPIWTKHAIRILPGPSSMWFDATGRRLPAPCIPGFDTMSTLSHIMKTGHDYSWFVLTARSPRRS